MANKYLLVALTLLFVGSTGIHSAENKVFIKPFEFIGDKGYSDAAWEAYYNRMHSLISKDLRVLKRSKRNVPSIKCAFQFIEDQIFFHLILEYERDTKKYYSFFAKDEPENISFFIDYSANFMIQLLKGLKEYQGNARKGDITFITYPAKAYIYINGKEYAKTNFKMTGLPLENEYNILLFKLGYDPYACKVLLTKENMQEKIDVNLTKSEGYDQRDIKFLRPSITNEDITPPDLIKKAVPNYPAIDREMGNEGAVEVMCILDDKGEVIGSELLTPCGSDSLNQAALHAASRCTFTPAYFKEVPLKYITLALTYEFKLGQRY